jgi:energy-coupling factor transporter ATP-binding protein EcfA2
LFSPDAVIFSAPARPRDFRRSTCAILFGREPIVTDLVERLIAQRKQFVAVVGASGSGKSSVVRAGLIPQLRRRRPPNELFTLTPAEQRQGFIDRLVASHGTAGLVLAPTLRADFYGQAIEANHRLSELLAQEQVALGRSSSEALSRAISEPARLARLEFEAGLPRFLLDDAGHEPGNLPLLQHALLEFYLWDVKLLESATDLRNLLCQTAYRNLTRAEWLQYAPAGEKYRAVCKHLPIRRVIASVSACRVAAVCMRARTCGDRMRMYRHRESGSMFRRRT